MNDPLVSIVTAAYQAEGELPETIASVLAQTFGDWEWLIVDDGSTDKTAAVAAAAGDPRIRVETVAHSGLPAVARNVALAQARGRYIAILDADDLWDPRKLELQIAVLESRPEIGLVHTAADRLVQGERVPGAYGSAPTAADLVRQNSIPSDSVVVRRELLTAHGGFDPDPGLWGSADYELWLRLLPHARFAYLPEPLLLYRAHETQMSAQRDRMHRGALLALEKTRKANAALDAEFCRAIGIRKCMLGEPGRGRRELLGALRQNPRDALAWTWLARAILGPEAIRAIGNILRGRRFERTV